MANALACLLTHLQFQIYLHLIFSVNQATSKSPPLGPLYCYECTTVDGIDDPRCLNPVRRKADEKYCGQSTGKVENNTSAGYVRCLKAVWFSIGMEQGRIFKSWYMRRTCYRINTGFMYTNSVEPPKCNECKIVGGRFRNQPSARFAEIGAVPPPGIYQEEVWEYRSYCTCCESLCNAEEGFNLTIFDENGLTGPKSVAHCMPQIRIHFLIMLHIFIPLLSMF